MLKSGDHLHFSILFCIFALSNKGELPFGGFGCLTMPKSMAMPKSTRLPKSMAMQGCVIMPKSMVRLRYIGVQASMATHKFTALPRSTTLCMCTSRHEYMAMHKYTAMHEYSAMNKSTTMQGWVVMHKSTALPNSTKKREFTRTLRFGVLSEKVSTRVLLPRVEKLGAFLFVYLHSIFTQMSSSIVGEGGTTTCTEGKL